MIKKISGMFFGMAALCVLAVGCNDEKTGNESGKADQETQSHFHGDPTYIANICNNVNDLMLESSLKLNNENREVFDGMWLEDSVVVLSIHTGKMRLDYVTKGILAIILPRIRGKVLQDLVRTLNQRKYVLPTNFFVAVQQNNYKMKLRYWGETGEKLDIPLTYEDMPEPYKKDPNPLAKKIDGYEAVTIGNQVWMAENMNRDIEGTVCYDHNPENCEQYGRLYDFKGATKICPEGWHLPDSSEFQELFSVTDKILTEEIAKNHELDSIVRRHYTTLQGRWVGDSSVTDTVHNISRILMSSEKTKSGASIHRAGLGYLGFNMNRGGKAKYYGSSENPQEKFEGLNSSACLWMSDTLDRWEKGLSFDFEWSRYERERQNVKCSVRCVQNQVKVEE